MEKKVKNYCMQRQNMTKCVERNTELWLGDLKVVKHMSHYRILTKLARSVHRKRVPTCIRIWRKWTWDKNSNK